MCSSTNFIKTLELNELVNHTAKLGAQKEKSLNPLSRFLLHLFLPKPPLFIFLYLFVVRLGKQFS